jgi:hypothetical protein
MKIITYEEIAKKEYNQALIDIQKELKEMTISVVGNSSATVDQILDIIDKLKK